MANSSHKKASNSPVTSWAQWFDRAASLFADPRMKIAYYRNGKTGKPYSQKAVRATLDHIWKKLKCRPEDVILDVGCGVGFFSRAFLKKIKKIIGVDISPQMIKSAFQLNPRATFLVCRADALCFKPKQFNHILSYGVTQYMAHASSVRAMLDNMRPLLQAGGRILIGDILDPISKTSTKASQRTTPQGKRWWPKELDHTLPKLYIPQKFFSGYSRKYKLTCKFFRQKIPGRYIPTPRYDVVMQSPEP